MIAGVIQSSEAARGPIPRAAFGGVRAELLVITLLLVLLNIPLLIGGNTAALAFRVDEVAAGEWWRVVTHPFVHVSWYHLLLDGAGFLSLYAGMGDGSRARRLAFAAASAGGSLLVALWASPLIASHGLCGLSGAAHGLMAASALETPALPRADRFTRIAALAGLAVVVGKCVIEAITGQALFTFLHFGLLGTPIVACHAGGVLGGLCAVWASRSINPTQLRGHSPLDPKTRIQARQVHAGNGMRDG